MDVEVSAHATGPFKIPLLFVNRAQELSEYNCETSWHCVPQSTDRP